MARKASSGKKSKPSKRKATKKVAKASSRSGGGKRQVKRAPAKKAPTKGRVQPKRAAKKPPLRAGSPTRSSAHTAGSRGSASGSRGATGAKAPARGKAPAPPAKNAPAKGAAGARTAAGGQATLDFEVGPPAAEPVELPTPKRRGSRVGGPDWPGENLTVGMPAPDFELPSTLGRKVSLKEFRGKRVILYFYPKDDTPGCTMEACAFRDNLPRFDLKDGIVLGVSLDDELSHQRFVQKYNLNFPLLSDVDAAVSRQYGVYKEKNLYGRSFWGIERTTFVIDREGKVENVFRRVKVEGHADEVLATLAV